MRNPSTPRGAKRGTGLTRREFLQAGTLSAAGLALPGLADASESSGRPEARCILLLLVGGPSHLDTFDPKPAAPAEVRGPFRPIRTSVPGLHISECFPRLAKMADQLAIVRSVHHDAAPIHETGHQLLQTGRLFRPGEEMPHFGAVASWLKGPARPGMPPFVVLPSAIGNTGVSVSHGQSAGPLGPEHEPLVLHIDPSRLTSRRQMADAVQASRKGLAPGAREAFDLFAENDATRQRYGHNSFGQSCLLARRLVESGVRLVTVNMFDSVFNELTWDCHADGGALPVTLDDYRETLCPMLDQAYTALLEDLSARGLLKDTLVLATGEFGRTPYLNARGGRDHWPGVWSMLLAGGGVRGGQVIGSSDRLGGEPKDRPVTPADIAATVYHSLGIDRSTKIPASDDRLVPLIEGQPILELF